VRMKRTQLGTAAAAIAASTALGMALAQSAGAVAPDPPPNSGGGAFTLSNNSPGLAIPDAGTLSRSITVAGQPGTVRDVDVVTNIIHQYNGEIEIELTHAPPAGAPKTVRFVTSKPANRGGAFGFNGTRWDDSALQIVSDAIEGGASGPQLNLVPEGAMASLIGRDPNGTWTLTVRDTVALDQGTLDGWTLDVKTAVPPTPPVTTQSFLGGGGGEIPDAGGALSTTLAVSGANGYLTDVNLGTNIVHDFPADLDVVLTSPSGTRVFISNQRPTQFPPPAPPNSSRSALTTIWDDSAPVDVVRALFPLAGSQIPSMVPEGALGAFIGENPNGVWTLTVADAPPAGDRGTVNSWNLTVSSVPGLPPRPPAPPPPPPPACTKVNLVTSILGAKRGLRGKTVAIKVRVRNRSRAAAANGAKAVFKLPNGFALVGKKKGIALRRGRVTITVGTIAAGKAKTITVRLRGKAKAKLGVKQSPVTVTALCGSKGTRAKIKVTLAAARR
jgi:subtilisin-like proprotein convertase family protein